MSLVVFLPTPFHAFVEKRVFLKQQARFRYAGQYQSKAEDENLLLWPLLQELKIHDLAV